MRRFFAYLLSLSGLLLVFSACSSKQSQAPLTSDSTQLSLQSSPLYAMPALENRYSDRLGGHDFVVIVSRQPDETLPKAIDELGVAYTDNRVEVLITKDGQDFFRGTYTKSSFLEALSQSEALGTVLLGMAYDSQKSSESILCLGAQIGQIGIEEGPAFTIEIPLAGGAPKIVRDLEQDTTGSQSYDL